MPIKRKEWKVARAKKLQAIINYVGEQNRIVEKSDYIEADPVQFMHLYTEKEDALIAAFFGAVLAWGKRSIVIAKVSELLERMGNKPYAFMKAYEEADFAKLEGFKHRTFKDSDMHWFCTAFRRMYDTYSSFEDFWEKVYKKHKSNKQTLMGAFHDCFFELIPEAPHRVKKHLANSDKNSSAKRLWLFLRWTIRDNSVVDRPLMHFIPKSELMIPLDVHVARWARALGLLARKQNDFKAVVELTKRIKRFAPEDPAYFDYGLFGIGVQGKEVPDEFIINPSALL